MRKKMPPKKKSPSVESISPSDELKWKGFTFLVEAYLPNGNGLLLRLKDAQKDEERFLKAIGKIKEE